MKLTSLLHTAAAMALFSVLSLFSIQTAHSQTETDLYNFCTVGGTNVCYDGEDPVGPLTVGLYGNYYGASGGGGTSFFGTVFGLFPEPSGGCESGTNAGNGWCEFVLYNFCSLTDCADGSQPAGGVSYLNAHFRTPGNFYGTTYYGGTHLSGVVFEVFSAPLPQGCPAGSNKNGGWCEKVLYNFCSYNIGTSCSDGYYPFGNLVEDAAGNLYGTNASGVFQLSPDQQGGYAESLFYVDSFLIPGLAIDSANNLYGVDANVGIGQAHVFKIPLSQPAKVQVIYTFNASAIGFANGPAVDGAGNIYGTTYGTSTNFGTVWKLTPVTTGKKAGTYQKRTLHTFTGAKNGQYPAGGVLLDSSGNIYGTTSFGGGTECLSGCGTLFELLAAGDIYKYKRLWAFNGTDGAMPDSYPLLNNTGALVGLTSSGGANNSGTMYQVTP